MARIKTDWLLRSRTMMWLALLAIVVLAVAACGDDTGEQEGADPEETTVETEETSAPTTEAPENTEAPEDDSTTTTAAGETGDLTVRVGGGPFISQAGLLIADARGYLDDVGLTMEFSEYIDGSVVVSGVVGGDLDIGSIGFGASFFNSKADGAPLIPILSRSQEEEGFETLATVVSPELYEEGIQSIDDLAQLEGRTVAVPGSGAINQYALARQMVEVGADPEAVNWNTGFGQPDIVQLLGAGEAEAANLASHFALMAEEAGSAVVIARGAVEPRAQVGGIAVREDFLENNREAVIRFVMAYIQGARDWDEAMQDPEAHEDTVQIIVDGTTIEDVDFMTDLYPYWSWVPPDGQINIDSVMSQQQFWVDHFGLIENPISEEQAWDDSIRQEAMERLEAENPFG